MKNVSTIAKIQAPKFSLLTKTTVSSLALSSPYTFDMNQELITVFAKYLVLDRLERSKQFVNKKSFNEAFYLLVVF